MELRVHLKVCEGCGCLWYRSQFDVSVYCVPCARRFKEFPTPQSRKRRGRPKKTILPTVFAVEDSSLAPPAAAFLTGPLPPRFRQHKAVRVRRTLRQPSLTHTPSQLISSPGSPSSRLSAYKGGAR